MQTVHHHDTIDLEDPKNGQLFKVNGKKLKPFLETQASDKVEVVILHDPIYAKGMYSYV